MPAAPPLDIDLEIARCSNTAYFIHNYCQVRGEDGADRPFHLWPAQLEALRTIESSRLVSILKARQTGFTTLMAAFCVKLAIFKPGSVILVFSKSHKEAKAFIARIKGTIKRLPEWLQPKGFTRDTTTELWLTNGSQFISFGSMSSGGDSYTANLVCVDEADLIRNLDTLLSGAKPTIDGGGKLVLLSRSEKSSVHAEKSSFKNIMRAALAGTSQYVPLFFPWWVRPGRTRTWYDEQKAEIFARTFSHDELFANYPETPAQALAAREQDKRFPVQWLEEVFFPLQPLSLAGTAFAGWSGLEIFKMPEVGKKYTLGADVAWGNPNSDDSVGVIGDKEALEEVAVLCGKIEPTVHAHRCAALAEFYNRAEILCERNGTHGDTCLRGLRERRANVLKGRDGHAGWWTDCVGKNVMYDSVAEVVRIKACIIHSKKTFDQLASLDVAELAAPFGSHDDRAVGFGLMVQASSKRTKHASIDVVTGSSSTGPPKETASREQFQGVKYFPTYSSYWAHVMQGANKIDLGEWETNAEAAHAVNAAHEFLGMSLVNILEPTKDWETIRAKVQAVLKAKGLLP
jgi:Terminase large subunit, T4likevirus-type, N-terminal